MLGSAGSLLSAVALVCGLVLATPLAAQGYPAKPVRLIVPYAPGGSTDLMARIVAEEMQKGLGQPVVVENKPGAGGAIGAEAVAKSPPDGYVVLTVGNGAITVNPHLTKLGFDPLKDLAPVALVATLPMVVAVHPSVPARSIGELISYLKGRPGAVNYSSNGLGSLAYLASELFKRMAGVNMVHVVYRGSAPATAAIVSGEVQFGFVDSAAAMAQARSGAVRALAVTDPKRSAIVAELPTIAESGLPGFEASAWIGMFAPSGTPAPIIARLNAEVARALAIREVRERTMATNMEPATQAPDAFTSYVKREFETWGRVIKDANITAQ